MSAVGTWRDPKAVSISRTRGGASAVATAVAMVASLGLFLFLGGGPMAIGGFVAMVLSMFVVPRLFTRTWEPKAGAIVDVDALALHLPRESSAIRIARRRIRGARAAGNRVVVDANFGERVTVDLEDEAQADSLVERLGFGLKQRTLEVETSNRLGRRLVAASLVGFLSFVLAVQLNVGTLVSGWEWGRKLLVFGLPVLLSAVAAALVRKTAIVVGVDGLRIDGTFSGRFIPYATIQSVQSRFPRSTQQERQKHPAGWMISTSDGKETFVRDPSESLELVTSVRERIAEAMALRHGGVAAPASLAREGRDVATWRQALARAGTAVGDFRKAVLPRDQLFSTLNDAATPLEQRVGAAIALRALDGDEARDVIRIAAETSADATTREALALLAAEEEAADAEVEAALVRAQATRE